MNNLSKKKRELSKLVDINISDIILSDEDFIETSETVSGGEFPCLTAIKIGNSLYSWCKYCERWHIHGLGDGHRVAHCHSNTPYNKRGYILKERTKEVAK